VQVNAAYTTNVYKIPVEIQGVKMDGIVDSGAEVSIISDKIFQHLEKNTSRAQEVILKNAGRDQRMKGFLTQPSQITLGKEKFCVSLYVAPIEDAFILGNDFMRPNGVSINMRTETLDFPKFSIPMYQPSRTEAHIHRITSPLDVTIPPHTIRRIKGIVPIMEKPYVAEVCAELDMWAPAVMHSAGDQPEMYLMNESDIAICLRANQVIGTAIELDQLQDIESSQTFQILGSTLESSTGPTLNQTKTGHIPEHLQDVYERSKAHLSGEDRKRLKALLIRHSDTFAKHDLDLGEVRNIVHKIDTGDARPIKQRLRHTPWGFEEEDAKHLKKMLDAGVIQPSTSEWAAAPVLIRKTDH
jgi:hypothetical protein